MPITTAQVPPVGTTPGKLAWRRAGGGGGGGGGEASKLSGAAGMGTSPPAEPAAAELAPAASTGGKRSWSKEAPASRSRDRVEDAAVEWRPAGHTTRATTATTPAMAPHASRRALTRALTPSGLSPAGRPQRRPNGNVVSQYSSTLE